MTDTKWNPEPRENVPINNSNNSSNNNSNNNYNNNSLPLVRKAEQLPDDYVETAEKVIRQIGNIFKSNQITASKIRRLLGLVMDIYNKEQLRSDATLLPTSQAALQALQIRVIYEVGRENMTRIFVQKAKLIEYLKWVGTSRENFVAFAHYMEALVAYHRYYDLGKKE